MCKEYTITDEDYDKIKDFVAKRKKDNELYKKRGGFREEDLWVGALAEFASYYYLQENGVDCSQPDLRILTKKEKSYDADIRSNSKFFHVKGQSLRSQKRYGNSWLLQRYDKIVQKKIKNHYLILCNVDVDNRKVEILGTPSISSIHNSECWSECKYYLFRKTKVALYLDEMKEKINNMWRI
jgi:hypothetical protein